MQFLFSNKLSDASLSRTLADTGRLPLFLLTAVKRAENKKGRKL
jgi:hypothetical protein